MLTAAAARRGWRRRAFNLVLVVSLLLCVAVFVLWLRSCWARDAVARSAQTAWLVASDDGALSVVLTVRSNWEERRWSCKSYHTAAERERARLLGELRKYYLHAPGTDSITYELAVPH